MFQLITPTRSVYTPIAFDVEPVAPELIAIGSDCLGSANGIFSDKGLWFRNRKAIVLCQNLHESMQAYIRIPTSYTHKTLSLEDLSFTLPPLGPPTYVLGFSYNFNHQGQVTLNEVETTLNDLVKINISHDASTPLVKVAVYYV